MHCKFNCITVVFTRTQQSIFFFTHNRVFIYTTAITAHSFYYWGIIKLRLNGNGMRTVYIFTTSMRTNFCTGSWRLRNKGWPLSTKRVKIRKGTLFHKNLFYGLLRTFKEYRTHSSFVTVPIHTWNVFTLKIIKRHKIKLQTHV